MFRSVLIAATLLGAAVPAFAEAPVSATPGALAGRSPHRTFIAADAARTSCGKTMHSLPAGKPHTYGLHALEGVACSQPVLADASPSTPVAGN